MRHLFLGLSIAMASSSISPAARAEEAPPPALAPVATPAPAAPPPTPELQRTNPNAIIGIGATLSVLGGLAVAGGLAMTTLGVVGGIQSANCADCDSVTYPGFFVIGLPMIAGGALLGAGGIALWVKGAREKKNPTPGPLLQSARPEIFVGPTGASMRWVF